MDTDSTANIRTDITTDISTYIKVGMINGLFIGTASWTIPRESASRFSQCGSHLERYGKNLSCVEINSSFYREHKADTYARWADSVPDHFKFSVKLSNLFTHERKLAGPGTELHTSVRAIETLGQKFGVLLIQLPASLEFSLSRTRNFFSQLRDIYNGPIALEPRNLTWTRPEAVKLLAAFRVSKVLADPEPCPISKAVRAPLETDLRYFRLHGTPLRYKSSYETERLVRIATAVMRSRRDARETWCVFDNTTFGFATLNALDLKKMTSHLIRHSKTRESPSLDPHL